MTSLPNPPRPYVAVVGGSNADEDVCRLAEEVGRELGRAGAVVVTGGRGGVMEAASRGAKAEPGAITLGILRGEDRSAANPWVDVAVPSGMGEARNTLVVRCGDVLVALGREYGTLSEIAFALRLGKPVIGIGTWDLGTPDPILRETDPVAAARRAIEIANFPR